MNDLLRSGERAWNLKRAINIRMGLKRENDKLPKALLEPLSDGPAAGYVPPLEAMLDAYYEARGLGSETGKPTPSKLRELGLEWVARDIWKAIRVYLYTFNLLSSRTFRVFACANNWG